MNKEEFVEIVGIYRKAMEHVDSCCEVGISVDFFEPFFILQESLMGAAFCEKSDVILDFILNGNVEMAINDMPLETITNPEVLWDKLLKS